MITDIFYPIFNLTITILACYTRKKAKLFGRFAPTCSPRYHPGPTGGLTVPPRPPASIVFGFAKNDAPKFFLYCPLNVNHIWVSDTGS